MRMRHLAVAAVVDDQQRVLMMWRHRFITDTWAWELPMGLIEDGETPERAASGEVLAETGWQVESLEPHCSTCAFFEPARSKHGSWAASLRRCG